MMLSEMDKTFIYKCYCWQERKIICISNTDCDSEVAPKEKEHSDE